MEKAYSLVWGHYYQAFNLIVKGKTTKINQKP